MKSVAVVDVLHDARRIVTELIGGQDPILYIGFGPNDKLQLNLSCVGLIRRARVRTGAADDVALDAWRAFRKQTGSPAAFEIAHGGSMRPYADALGRAIESVLNGQV